MDLSLERDSSALGSLFQQIINDMKNTSPLWEDFVAKASKLHTCLRAAIQAIAAYLDAFQKIADAATNSRGASKEIGTALTRVCLRHKAVETRLKTFTSAIMDCLVQPLQDKIEDWKRTVATIDKDHAKEYKRCRSELKKRSSDTLRLQKKARKGQTDNSLQSLMDSHMQDVTLRRAELEEVEKKSLRAAMVEERLRYCSFVHMLQPVVHEECEVMSELGHLQEAMESIALVTKEPSVLPQASEELIHDAKASINLYPESPGGGSGSQGGGCSNSLGSRKSSVCSISSMNSSGSSNSPGHHHYQRSLSQFVTPAIRLKPGESSDSGFCSSPALTTQVSNATNQTHAVSTWPPHSQDAVDALPPTADRPHTISTTYEKGHQRPPLTVYTFQNPETIHESNSSGSLIPATVPTGNGSASGQNTPATQKSPAASLSRPPLPVKPAHVRCSSLERPLSAQSNHRQNSGQNLLQRQCPSPIPAHITKGGAGGGGGGAAMGSSTRIARRSSINQAKPPPPVRRSSSVTPSPNNVGQPQHQQHSSSNHNSHAYQQQSLSLSNSSEHLPPPPAFMLEATTAYSTSPTPPAAMPSSALKVSETVRALAAMRHQPASPVALRRMHQQQQQQQQLQQQQQQSLLQPMHKPSPNDDAEYEAYYNSYMELHAYAQALPPQQQQQQHQQQQQQQQRFAQQHHTSHQTHHHNHHEQLPPTPPPYHGPPQVDAASFRTSSPSGSIYAQPKLVNNMSSFRTSSPSPNGHAHPLPPTQPKANPNLIAQLNARLNSKQQQQQHQQQQQQHVAEGIYGNAGGVGVGGGESIYMRGGNGLSMSQQQQQQQHYDAAAQATANMRQHQQQHQLQQQQQQHYTCPPPLEDPPPPPIYSATMPKKMARPSVGHSNSNNMGNHLVNAYAAASNSATLPKNILQQQRLQQQQQQQHQQQLQQQQLQQQQYQQPTGINVGNGHANQRPPMPLPQQQQHAQQQQQQQQRQPPIPSRHSSVQQKIFVSTNPFIQTTAVKFHSPSSVHSTPAASPTCGSPASSATMASIYGTTARGGAAHHQQQQQQQYHHQQQQHQQQQQQQQQHYYRDVAGGNSNGGVYYASHNNVHAHGHSNAHAHANANANVNANANAHTPHMPHVQAHHSNYATSTNIEKTGSIRAKTKAEFLENLNAKLAKQGMSGRAFAVRNLINSKALPDPRICHESLMDQIKRGATLKRNQKINDRSAPKIH
ncbi:protein naked cuticle isoform X23 [Drosophila sulfurigaster albostrigata]|uniref:protein naked cuticle isoform X23 n=1 Tax=Drosophila sulfurigaster albostrigata TaxID=89887 RepID=UPI002D21DACE|nr:protein naked cuticle isoform X23 [Drosophila sulfurigaster albostrigata]